jgi:hypothetical protein
LEEPRKDVDEAILDTLKTGSSLSPSALEKACASKGIKRPTYFRHLKKLKRLMQIEEIMKVDDERRQEAQICKSR